MESDRVRKAVTKSGLTLVGEPVQHVRSFALGVWVKAGSRDESPDQAGISHFIEHMLFKGTKHRTAAEIASSLESLGGHLDGFTERECACYSARAMDEHLEAAVDVLSDIVCNSTFEDDLLEKEKGVVLEEIKNVEDTPDELIHDMAAQAVWREHPLGGSILGRAETVGSFTREVVVRAFAERYVARNLVISAAGHFDFEKLLALVEEKFSLPEGDGVRRDDDLPDYTKEARIHRRDLAQQYLCLCKRTFGYEDPARYDLRLLNTVLGDGMSSRLFQKVREQAGLAYAVYSYVEMYSRTGIMCIFMGVPPQKAASCLDLVREEMRALAREGITEKELEAAKAQFKGSLTIGLESMSVRMARNARGQIYFGDPVPVDEVLRRVESRTVETVSETAERLGIGDDDFALVSIGPGGEDELGLA